MKLLRLLPIKGIVLVLSQAKLIFEFKITLIVKSRLPSPTDRIEALTLTFPSTRKILKDVLQKSHFFVYHFRMVSQYTWY
ncbi:hypothetical protein DERP_004587 [Dermatophagoides pteronyssinus]|uniref:Secreted protein n=1 Tax=Dermatophagoides pteronyssinus TaxID=6956 RepID=A0ABQ8JP70_DERPT|nr:hypothetical protein DERP_004587 [Dermatophagoides pteronyssinus]